MFVCFSNYAWCEQSDTIGCSSGQCHNSMIINDSTHSVGVECTSCHLDQGSSHPNEKIVNFSFASDMCASCHTKVFDYDYLHAPVAAGECPSCHLLHGNKESNLLKSKQEIVCYNCHNPVTNTSDTFFHGEVSENKCGACHTAHGSFFPNLLTGGYSVSFFNDYKVEHYALCFKCHKNDILLHPRTSYNTKFRDGKRNLHYLHVNKKNKGRSCKSCHKTHSGTEPHLLADSVPFGNWQMPVNFQPTENGGRCSPGCHAPTDYDRKKRK